MAQFNNLECDTLTTKHLIVKNSATLKFKSKDESGGSWLLLIADNKLLENELAQITITKTNDNTYCSIKNLKANIDDSLTIGQRLANLENHKPSI